MPYPHPVVKNPNNVGCLLNAEKYWNKLKVVSDDTNESPKGVLPTYADGGYPLIYITQQGNILCAECATDHNKQEWSGYGYMRRLYYSDFLVDYDTYLEGATLNCDQCSAVIESAYGDPDCEICKGVGLEDKCPSCGLEK